MPKFMVRTSAEVPAPDRTTKAVREQQQLYEDFIRQATGNVGEINLEPGDAMRSIKVKLRRAGTRLGTTLEIWDANGKVYFQGAAPKRRGRPRKAAS
jgi:hypothetical protein